MPLGLIAKKVGMSRIFREKGEVVPVTYLTVAPHTVIRTKTKEKDGYDAVILGVGPKTRKTRKGKELLRYRVQKEWQVESLEGWERGKTLTLEAIPIGSIVTVMGVSKGKGFQGVMKRYHFAGGPASHGSHMKREPGSVGMRGWPGRIFRGHHMAGRMGGDQITLHHRPVLVSDPAEGIIGIGGPVPGAPNATVFLTIETAPQP